MIKVGTHFSGIGSPEQALKQMGINFECLFAAERDKYAQQTYLANHETKVMFDDVTKIDNENCPYVDLFFSGFPCQTFSIAGARKGFEDVRGTMFFYSADYIRKQRPRVFIMENVKGLLSHDRPKGSKAIHGNTFNTMINLLAKTINGQTLLMPYEDNLGYNIFYKVLNSKHYDVPQNRERIFIIGFRDDADIQAFRFPSSKIVSKKLADVLEPIVDKKYYLSEKIINGFLNKPSAKNYPFKPLDAEKQISNCLTARYYKMAATDPYVITKQGPRRLTVRECARLQGFINNFLIPVSDTQGYKQMGNTITTFVIEAILKNIKIFNNHVR